MAKRQMYVHLRREGAREIEDKRLGLPACTSKSKRVSTNPAEIDCPACKKTREYRVRFGDEAFSEADDHVRAGIRETGSLGTSALRTELDFAGYMRDLDEERQEDAAELAIASRHHDASMRLEEGDGPEDVRQRLRAIVEHLREMPEDEELAETLIRSPVSRRWEEVKRDERGSTWVALIEEDPPTVPVPYPPVPETVDAGPLRPGRRRVVAGVEGDARSWGEEPDTELEVFAAARIAEERRSYVYRPDWRRLAKSRPPIDHDKAVEMLTAWLRTVVAEVRQERELARRAGRARLG